MAKKRSNTTDDNQRRSRKEVLIAKRHEQQTRRVWIFVVAVIALIVVVFVFGIVNEMFLKPSRPVATISGEDITLGDWRDQVEYRRALLVSRISEIADVVAGDVAQIQQIAGQELQAISDPETLGLQVLEEMIDQELIRQEAEARGISVSEDEVQNSLEERFLYFDGESPTPQPTPTETIMPTPSITPIARETNESAVSATPTATQGPPATPLPTPTVVSRESFEETLGLWYGRLNEFGVDEEMFRMEIQADLYRERLLEVLAVEADVSDEAEQISIFYIRFEDQEEADAAREDMDSSDYLTVWNTINSRTEEEQLENTSFAGELLWRTADNLESILGPDIRQGSEELDIEEPSEVIVVPAPTEDGSDAFFIIMPNGREVRPLTEAAFANLKLQNFSNWLDVTRLSDVLTFERWRANIPQRPLLDTRSWIYPTPVPTASPGEPVELIPQPTPG